MPLWIALIRAIGPATHKKMTMADLRTACTRAGFHDVQTVLATGNVIFTADAPEPEIAATLRQILDAHGLDNAVFLRRPEALAAILALNPLPEAAASRPNHMLVQFLAAPAGPLGPHDGPETLIAAGREVYIDYAEGIGRSKLTPARLERLIGQPGTARNWNTVAKLRAKATA